MDIHLIRHPRTIAPRGTCYGASDIAADPEILEADAARLAPTLPENARFLSSPMTRAHSLANRLAGQPVPTDQRLVELNFGAWENRLWSDIPRAEIDAWAADTGGYTPPDGESVNTLAARVIDWWNGIEITETPLVVVTHGGPLRVIATHILGAPPANSMALDISWGGRALVTRNAQSTILKGWNLR